MLIITGPGRSGTSLLAKIYKNAGANVTGTWSELERAGFEDASVVDLNKRILGELNTSQLGYKRSLPRLESLPGRRVARIIRSSTSPTLRRNVRVRLQNRSGNTFHSLTLPEWGQLPRIVEEMGEAMQLAAGGLTIVKDPQFCLTLPVWIAAGVEIDHVLASTRSVEAMLKSRIDADQTGFSINDQRNALMLSWGVLMATLESNPGIPSTCVRFPAFVKEADNLARLLPLVQGVSREDLIASVHETVDSTMISEK